MKNKIFINWIKLSTLSLGLLFIVSSCETDETQTVATFQNLVMQDEFNTNGALNSDLWNQEIGTGPNDDGWGNNELQYYTDRTENVTVSDGYLLITAKEEAFEGSNYTSARISTQGKFEQAYGRFEARIRMPYGKGYWPAFWLLGNDCDTNDWPQCGEIDIMEYIGNLPTQIVGSIHGPGYCGNASICDEEEIGKEYFLANDRFDAGFHVFGIEWGPDYINYYVDGDLYQQITRQDVFDETDGEGDWVFDKPFYIVLNLAIGGELPGAPNEETIFPQTMLVDYVRVYQE